MYCSTVPGTSYSFHSCHWAADLSDLSHVSSTCRLEFSICGSPATMAPFSNVLSAPRERNRGSADTATLPALNIDNDTSYQDAAVHEVYQEFTVSSREGNHVGAVVSVTTTTLWAANPKNIQRTQIPFLHPPGVTKDPRSSIARCSSAQSPHCDCVHGGL